MDDESYNTISFYGLNILHLRQILDRIQFFDIRKIIPNLDYSGHLDEEMRLVLFEKLSQTELSITLMDYRNWLENDKLISLGDKNQLIVAINDFLKEISGKCPEEDYRLFYQSEEKIKEKFHFNFFLIFDSLNSLLLKLKKTLDLRITNLSDNQELYYQDLSVDLTEIFKSYEELKTYKMLSLPLELIKSSESSLQYGLHQLDNAFKLSIFMISKQDERKEEMYSFLTSALFLFVSAYDKLIFSISSCFNNQLKESAYNSEICKSLEDFSPELYKELIEHSDRKDMISTAKKLRNSATHRISNFELEEVKGYLITLIKEILRILLILKKDISFANLSYKNNL
jgi:hypothetical protein